MGLAFEFASGNLAKILHPFGLCFSPPFAYIEFVQLKKIVKNLSVVVTTNEFQNSGIFFIIYKRTDGSFTVHTLYYLKTKTRSENVQYGQKMKKLDFEV